MKLGPGKADLQNFDLFVQVTIWNDEANKKSRYRSRSTVLQFASQTSAPATTPSNISMDTIFKIVVARMTEIKVAPLKTLYKMKSFYKLSLKLVARVQQTLTLSLNGHFEHRNNEFFKLSPGA